MTTIVKRKRVSIDWDATFSKMQVGQQIGISVRDAAESNVRVQVSRYNKNPKNGGVKLVAALMDDMVTTSVYRQS